MGLMNWLTRSVQYLTRRISDSRAWEIFSPGPDAAGVVVNERTAMNCSAFFAGVRVYADAVGMLPCGVYEVQRDGQKKAVEHATEHLLLWQPNSEMSAFSFKETLQAHVLVYGNAYAEIERNRKGDPIALWPMCPNRVDIVRSGDGEIYYEVRIPGEQKPYTLSAADVLHIPGLGFDGLRGYGIVEIARQTIALTMAAESSGAKYFESGMRPDVILTHPSQLDDEPRARMRKDWESNYGGLSRKHRLAILEEGVTYQQLTHTPEEAQFLATRQFQLTEIARILRLPPHMIGDLSRSTNNNIEFQGDEFVRYSLRPWLMRWTHALRWKLLTDTEKARGLTYDFVVDELVRGDMSSRYAAKNGAISAGWMTPNEARAGENLPPHADGDKLKPPPNQSVPANPAKPEPQKESPNVPAATGNAAA